MALRPGPEGVTGHQLLFLFGHGFEELRGRLPVGHGLMFGVGETGDDDDALMVGPVLPGGVDQGLAHQHGRARRGLDLVDDSGVFVGGLHHFPLIAIELVAAGDDRGAAVVGAQVGQIGQGLHKGTVVEIAVGITVKTRLSAAMEAEFVRLVGIVIRFAAVDDDG